MPVLDSSKIHMRFLGDHLAFRIVVLFLVVSIFTSFGAALRAQTIEVKIINGRNGNPIANKCMYVWAGDRTSPSSGPLLTTQTNISGVIKLHLANDDKKGNTESQRMVCGLEGVIDPIVKYGDTISIRTGYVLCQPHAPDYSWLSMSEFSAQKALQRGIVTANTCGKATALPEPGEVVLFVRPLTWWEKLKQ